MSKKLATYIHLLYWRFWAYIVYELMLEYVHKTKIFHYKTPNNISKNFSSKRVVHKIRIPYSYISITNFFLFCK